MAQYTRLTKEQRDLIEKILQGEKNMPSPLSLDTLPKEMIPYDPNYLHSLKFRKGLEDFEDYRQNRITFPESETPTFENANRSPYSLGESRDIKNMLGTSSPSPSPSPNANRDPSSYYEQEQFGPVPYYKTPKRIYDEGMNVLAEGSTPLTDEELLEILQKNSSSIYESGLNSGRSPSALTPPDYIDEYGMPHHNFDKGPGSGLEIKSSYGRKEPYLHEEESPTPANKRYQKTKSKLPR